MNKILIGTGVIFALIVLCILVLVLDENKDHRIKEYETKNVTPKGISFMTPQDEYFDYSKTNNVSQNNIFDSARELKSQVIIVDGQQTVPDIREINFDKLMMTSGFFSNYFNLTKVQIDDILSIPSESFKDCFSLKEVIFMNTRGNIGDSAFENCNNIETIDFPLLQGTIGDDSFKNCIN